MLTKKLQALTLLILLSLLLSTHLAFAGKIKKSVLYLNSYHNGYQWSDGLLAGIRNELNNSKFKVDLQIEYMDAKKFNYDTLSKNLLPLYREKFKNESFDVIVLSDNDALNFINEHRQELFPGVPVVFCGINNLKKTDIAAGNITGIEEVFDLQATFEVAKKLHPNKDKVLILGDHSTAGRAIQQQVENILQQRNLGLEVEYLYELGLEETKKKVEVLPDNYFLFFTPYYQTIRGKFYTSEEVIEAVSSYSSVPIYTGWEFMVGYGAVGGKLLSGLEHGRTAGKMVLQILNGVDVNSIPIINKPSGIYLFDYKVMKKLGIDSNLLPENSTIINSPKAFYELSKELFWTIIISLILLFITLLAMLGAMIERRKVERKITDQLAFQETLMDTIPQLVSWKSVEGKYLGANQAFVDFFGITETNRVVARTTREIVEDKSYAEWSISADFSVVERKKSLRKIRKKVSDPDGKPAWLEVNKVPLLDQAGRIVGILSTAENITKEQSLEKQLIQSQKMEAIGTLAGGIAHDFNNILTSIINSTELALGDLTPHTQTTEDLNRVLKAAKRGGRVVQQILSFSRPSREGFRPTDITRIVHEVIHLMEASTPGNIKISAYIDKKRRYFVQADPTQLHQAILNLCTNAFHALQAHGGKIDLQISSEIFDAENPTIANLSPGNYIRLCVTDNGPGIKAEIIDKIFDPFFSTKSKTEGTGLGLAVVHGIVKNHLGTIRVSSAEMGGSAFEIFLPEAEPGEAVFSENHFGTQETGGSILFVEDDEDQLQTTPRLLTSLGFNVTALRDPDKAIRLASTPGFGFEVLITDFDMPTMSGTELASFLPDLPVILISGRNDAKIAAKKHANICRVIAKPYDKKDLLAAIRQVIRK